MHHHHKDFISPSRLVLQLWNFGHQVKQHSFRSGNKRMFVWNICDVNHTAAAVFIGILKLLYNDNFLLETTVKPHWSSGKVLHLHMLIHLIFNHQGNCWECGNDLLRKCPINHALAYNLDSEGQWLTWYFLRKLRSVLSSRAEDDTSTWT